jgi:YesN/AraC family two-component response regulator
MLKKVYIAKDGEEGLRLYQKVSPDIVLTDMYMPKMNGFEMATKIKTLKSTQVIGLFSGDSEEKINTKSDLNPIDIFISKPLNRSEFHKALITLTKLSIN